MLRAPAARKAPWLPPHRPSATPGWPKPCRRTSTTQGDGHVLVVRVRVRVVPFVCNTFAIGALQAPQGRPPTVTTPDCSAAHNDAAFNDVDRARSGVLSSSTTSAYVPFGRAT
jgi:hypothetical protein